ncbi:hypothetical protein DSCA_38500 [Desulfosarcina alkanivorans]|uniref:Permease n=1 Tax=Desulfosarcina alkanivorans TaxID=571177 RepID=A0A5K7YNR2_9BACT|nr:permease [Desulfosarcina alkanivorans]BBO69920.1 hypothetical protein DSCA_38500 [Desulfosarcina alkanivorans]
MSPPIPAEPTAHPTHHHPPPGETGSRFFIVAQFGSVAALVGLIVFFRRTPGFATLSITFVSIFLEALPFMLLGAAIGGFIEVFVSKTAITRIVPARPLPAILLAAGLGLVFPVCECAIVPVVRRLFQKGLPLGAGIAFLLGGPIVNPLVALSTAVAYGNDLLIAGYRLAAGYLIAVAMGLLIDRLFSRKSALLAGTMASLPESGGGLERPAIPLRARVKMLQALGHGASDFLDTGRFLVVGALVAGLLQTLVARGDLAAVSGSPSLSILAMMILAIVLSLCSEADAFVAASFRTSLPLGAQMAFMVLGPMLDLKLLAMYFRIFRKRLILVLSVSTGIIVFLSMMAGTWMGQ